MNDNITALLVNLIPQPQQLMYLVGSVSVPERISIGGDRLFGLEMEMFPLMVPQPVLNEESVDRSWLRCHLDRSEFAGVSESYQMEINLNGVDIRAGSKAGMFYALQTIRQLLVSFPEQLPCLQIRDEPRFQWRGLLIDEARHFLGMEQIKQILDWMAALKLNTLHWHLTDYQGWRIEIKAYPELTEIGSQRKHTQRSGFGVKKKVYREEPHLGFYSQQDIRKIIQYAAERKITIVPEFDFPGHFLAAIAAYPYLGCRKTPVEVTGDFGILPFNACVGDERTLVFLRRILDEICGLFPGDNIHIGGDEVDPADWRECALCRQKMQELGYSDIHHLQDWLMNNMSAYLISKGKKAFVYDDADHGHLGVELGMVYWLGKRKKGVAGIKAKIKRGQPVVFQPFRAAYFDWPYALVPLRASYSMKQLRNSPEKSHPNLLGVQGALWTEFVDTPERLQWCLFPRLAALAEMAWTTESQKDLKGFWHRWMSWDRMRFCLGISASPQLAVVNPLSPFRRIWIILNSVFKSMWFEQELTKKSLHED